MLLTMPDMLDLAIADHGDALTLVNLLRVAQVAAERAQVLDLAAYLGALAAEVADAAPPRP